MPYGTIFMHQTLSSIFIKGEDGKYYQPRPEVTLAPGTRVTFDELKFTDAPPGFYFATNVAKYVEPTPVETTTPTPKLGIWGKPLPTTMTTPSTPVIFTKKLATPPALPVPQRTPRVLNNRTTREDFEAIARKVAEMDWGRQQGFGPSLQVTTPLKWADEGIELYLRVHEEYQDVKIPGNNLWYYVGTMGVNKCKAGFRISAHSKPKASIDKAKTYTVLHIEN